MSGEMDFDFSDAELLDAFRLVASSEEEARQQAAAVRNEFKPGMDWAASREFLLLLSVGSTTSRDKAERIRKLEQETRLRVVARDELSDDSTALSDSDVRRRVQDAVEVEDRRWQDERAELRRTLLRQGKRLPDEP